MPIRPFRPVTAFVLGAAVAVATREEKEGGARQAPLAPASPAPPVTDQSAGGVVTPGDTTASRQRWSSLWSKSSNKGYYVPKSELEKIDTIDCLKAKQSNPMASCTGTEEPSLAYDATYAPPWGPGNYPTWKHPMCNSGGEYFCDPDNALSREAQSNITAALKRMRETSVVTCKYATGTQRESKKTFFLGVAVAKDWPIAQADPASLQQFGLVTMAKWGMEGLWMGPQVNYASCASVALLVVLPKGPHVLLASPSCAFICKDKGGPLVQASVLQNIDSDGGGLQEAIEEGIKAVAAIIKYGDVNAPKSKAFWKMSVSGEAAFTLWQQLILIGIVVVVIMSGLFVLINAMFPALAIRMGISARPSKT